MRSKKFKDEKFCKACGISSNVKQLYTVGNVHYCLKHQGQLNRYGKTLDTSQRTVFDPNEYILYENEGYAEIVLYNQDTSEAGRALIDIEDIEKCKPYKWRLTDKSTNRKVIKYVYSGSGAGNQLPLHRLITDCPLDMVADHRDNNPLNNRKYNLRVVTEEDNYINKSIKDYHKLGFSGIYKDDKGTQPYRTEIQLYKKRVYFRNFDNLEECVLIRFLSELALFRDKRSQNNDRKLFDNTLKFNEIVILKELDYICDKIKNKIPEFNANENKLYVMEYLIKNNLIKGDVNDDNV